MGSNALDLDELSLIKKRRPWGWFFSGLLLIALGGFALGLYLPLREAHHLLATEHEKLAQKAKELDASLVETRKLLDAESEKVRGFERGERDLERTKRLAADESEALRSGIASSLQTLADKKILVVEPTNEGARATLPAEVVFPRGAKAVVPSLTKSLCTLVRPAKERSSLVLAVEVPLTNPLDAGSLTLGTAQLASLAGALGGACRLPADRVRLALVPAEASSPGTGENAARVVFSFAAPPKKVEPSGGLLEGAKAP